MPQKQAARPRTWGSRFDTLPSSPPPSPKPRFGVGAASPTRSVRGRLSISTTPGKTEKMPHDASVFVGSLPPNMDHGELSRLLHHHLSEHTEVKFVKVVRDSKGGNCAFVQCQDAAAAANLIKTLHSSPHKPFLGRILRYEPARAFRTLLMSYRVPTQFIPASSTENAASAVQAYPSPGKFEEIELPSAMRIWKTMTNRNPYIRYNADAVEAAQEPDCLGELESAVHLEPVSFDEQTMQKLASFFGDLEYFGVHKGPEGTEGDAEPQGSDLPPGHDSPRKPGMDERCFEIKWCHRDDCVVALNILNRVPHLRVTWANQPHAGGQKAATSNLLSIPPYIQGPFQGYVQDSPNTNPAINEAASPAKVKWSDTDFPPLCDFKGDRRAAFVGAWVDNAERDAGGNRGSSARALFPVATREIDVPPTPGLATSPDTPKTSTTTFPPTPTSMVGSYPGIHPRSAVGPQVHAGSSDGVMEQEKMLDPMTLFVGGLEMHGPTAWDENKVLKHFERFGGIDSVKVVRPVNGRAAFAFVKFDNTESPARAVAEEHNRIFEGRMMRVQFRDCNPRGPWKTKGHRGGRSMHQINDHSASRYGHNFSKSGQGLRQLGDELDSTENAEYGIISPHSTIHRSPASKRHSQGDLVTPSTSTASSHATDAPDGPPAVQAYREWYDNEPQTESQSPPPLTPFGYYPHPTLPGVGYPVMPAGYYGPAAPWMQMPYGHYMYPHYSAPTQPPSQASYSSGGSDDRGPTSTPPAQVPTSWPMAAYGAYASQQGIPPRFTTFDPSCVQAPVVPTGFIQNDQGILIPVYPPDALNRYMTADTSAASTTHPAPPQSQTTPSSAPPMNGASHAGWPHGLQYPQNGLPAQGPARFNVPSGRPGIPMSGSPSPIGWFPAGHPPPVLPHGVVSGQPVQAPNHVVPLVRSDNQDLPSTQHGHHGARGRDQAIALNNGHGGRHGGHPQRQNVHRHGHTHTSSNPAVPVSNLLDDTRAVPAIGNGIVAPPRDWNPWAVATGNA